MLNRLLLALSVSLLLLGAREAGANLLPNPEFETDLSGWNNTAGKVHSTDDSDGGSGSVQFDVGAIASDSMTTCVPVSASTGYQFNLDIKLDISPNNQGRAGMVIRFKGETDCGGEDIGAVPANTFLTNAPDWTKQGSETTSPEGAVAALVALTVTKTDGTGGSVVANLDEVFFDLAEGEPGCGNPVVPFNLVTASDALHVLRASVELLTCELCICDVNDSGATTANDALAVLRVAVELPGTLDCVQCG